MYTHACACTRGHYLSINKCCQRKVVKEISEVLPDIGIAIFSETLVIEAIDLSDLSALMVASQDCYSVRKAYLW